MNRYKIGIVFILLSIASCSSPTTKKQVALYEQHCASCHLAPSIKHLPKNIWETKILPDMAARMGIKEAGYNPMDGLSFEEMEATIKTGIYPLRPTLSKEDWNLLKEYIVSMAPDSLEAINRTYQSQELNQFKTRSISLDSAQGSFITFLEYNQADQNVLVGDMNGNLLAYDYQKQISTNLGQFHSPIVAYTKKDSNTYATTIGQLNPTELSSGRVFTITGDSITPISALLHRPVHMVATDLNKDGEDELIVSEFGNLTGALSLLTKNDSLTYTKRILLNQPGAIRVLTKDMNNDGKEDIVALTSQGDETITILYQQDDMNFLAEKVLRFSPIYGTSWFELIDYDGDGDDDIITVHGDNADKSYVQKPYHGMRIHINDGKNNFEEKHFHALNGATRLVARDFDQDGDIDVGVLSTFPDYENYPEFSFVYLENSDAKTFKFKEYTFKDSNVGRWFLLDAGDVDNDGDEDIVLSSFTYVFTPVPAKFTTLWNEKNVDIMVLENKLNPSTK